MDLCRDERPLHSVAGQKLFVVAGPSGVGEAEANQHGHDCSEAEGGDRTPQGHGCNQAVAVGHKEQATNRGALEDRLNLASAAV